MAIKLTATANAEVKKIISETKESGVCPADAEVVLRFAITGASCSGLQYGIGLEDVKNVSTEEDSLTEEEGVKIVVWKEHLPLLEGTVIDYDENGFSISNPNALNGCHGCSHESECGPEEENENSAD